RLEVARSLPRSGLACRDVRLARQTGQHRRVEREDSRRLHTGRRRTSRADRPPGSQACGPGRAQRGSQAPGRLARRGEGHGGVQVTACHVEPIRPNWLKFSGGIRRFPPRLLLALLDEPHHVAFRIGEESERDPARHLNRWLNGLATEAFDLVQCRLRVVNTNVERDVPRTLWRFADPAVDATPLLLLVHHAVFQRAVIRRAELPTERFRVELSQDARVAPQDLEMDDRIPHLVLHWAKHALRYMTTSVIIGGIISADACRPPSFDPSPAPGSWPDERRRTRAPGRGVETHRLPRPRGAERCRYPRSQRSRTEWRSLFAWRVPDRPDWSYRVRARGPSGVRRPGSGRRPGTRTPARTGVTKGGGGGSPGQRRAPPGASPDRQGTLVPDGACAAASRQGPGRAVVGPAHT